MKSILSAIALLLASVAEASVLPRDGTCAVQPAGSGPVASPDTAAAFLANQALWQMALNAETPSGYVQVFKNLKASLSADKYMGLHTLKSYSTKDCAKLCSDTAGCEAFNLYAERDPTKDPNVNDCPNPPSTTNYKCTLWGAPVKAEQANNYGQWRAKFEVVISASNAYNKGCIGGTCSTYTTCSLNKNCFCVKTTEGGSACASNNVCNRPCTSSSHCNNGGVCVKNSCCPGGNWIGYCSGATNVCSAQSVPVALSFSAESGPTLFVPSNADPNADVQAPAE